jgi:cytochrome c oxidase cbb3-type subunit 4
VSGGIVTLLSLLGFLAIVVWVFIIKRREDFDEQASLPLEDSDDVQNNAEHEHREKES